MCIAIGETPPAREKAPKGDTSPHCTIPMVAFIIGLSFSKVNGLFLKNFHFFHISQFRCDFFGDSTKGVSKFDLSRKFAKMNSFLSKCWESVFESWFDTGECRFTADAFAAFLNILPRGVGF